MNKYELQQIELKQKWDLECKQYDVNAQQLNSVRFFFSSYTVYLFRAKIFY